MIIFIPFSLRPTVNIFFYSFIVGGVTSFLLLNDRVDAEHPPSFIRGFPFLLRDLVYQTILLGLGQQLFVYRRLLRAILSTKNI